MTLSSLDLHPASRFDARRYTADTLRLSSRAITVVFVCSRASVFSMRSSSFVHGRLRVIFFAISVPHAPMLVFALSTPHGGTSATGTVYSMQ